VPHFLRVSGAKNGQDRSADGDIQCHCADVDEPLVGATEHICDLGCASMDAAAGCGLLEVCFACLPATKVWTFCIARIVLTTAQIKAR
jgi:hypothetical protein